MSVHLLSKIPIIRNSEFIWFLRENLEPLKFYKILFYGISIKPLVLGHYSLALNSIELYLNDYVLYLLSYCACILRKSFPDKNLNYNLSKKSW
jgi:hypothetical protein